MCEKKIISPWIINPFFYYSIFWIIALCGYFISPSKLAVNLDEGLLCFLLITITVSTIVAYFFNIHYKNRKFKVNYYKQKNTVRIILILLYILEFVYCKSVPLLFGKSYSSFGIPTVHVVIVTLSCKKLFPIYYIQKA